MSGTPQFGTAEYQPQGSDDKCKTCGEPITGQYFRVNEVVTCPTCAQKASSLLPKDSSQVFMRALICGAVGALAGLILYAGVGIITGLEIGYVSVAVGWLVGKGILLGSGGVGGRRYQIAAVILTYIAVSMSAVPIILYQVANDGDSKTQEERVADKADPNSAETKSGDPESSEMSFGAAMGTLVLVGLASPLLGLSSPVSGLIGLVILFVGIQIAWRMTAGNKVSVRGPYTVGSSV
jgi:hypothetical protein